jgi:molybdopterin molybdotransferase
LTTSRIGGFKHTTKIEDALDKMLKALGNVRPVLETIPTDSSLGRILGEDIISPFNVPSYDKSAVDGYAVIAEDTFGSSQTNPVELRVVGEIAAGSSSSIHIGKNETVQVATGAHIPSGANAVVMVEQTKKINVDTIHVYSSIAPSENVVKAGDDVRKGSVALRRSVRIEPQDIGMLMALGLENILVAKKPNVGVLSTGEELVSNAREGGLGKTVDVNRPILCNFVKEYGGIPIDLGIARDQMEDISRRIGEGLEKCDLVLVSAGTSVGKADLVPDVINSLGKPGMLVHGISMRPGMPAGLAVVNNKAIISLPGHPVAAIVSFKVFVLPLIHLMLGAIQDFRTLVQAKLTRRIPSSLGMRTFARVLVRQSSEGYVAEPVRTSGSSILSTMTRSNGIVVIPEEREGIEKGETVEVELFRPIEKVSNYE